MEEEADSHVIFKKDPEEWMQYVYKQVRVLTEDSAEHTGWVYTIDPVSESVVLTLFDADDNTGFEIIKGCSITKITAINNNTELHKSQLDEMFRPAAVLALTQEERKKRQLLLKSWLDKNRMPVTVDGELLTIADVLVVEPPYGAENCRSTNEIVLGRIQGLIKNMPKDHDTW